MALKQPDPDEKDWTFVISARCPECGFDGSSVAGPGVAAATREVVGPFRRALAEPAASTRPAETIWSALEYGAHVRDVCTIFRERLTLMLAQDNPPFANWDQDATAVEKQYWLQDPAVVSAELAAAAESMAQALDDVPADAWERPGTRSNGSQFTVDTLSRYFLHDLRHHLYDIRPREGDEK